MISSTYRDQLFKTLTLTHISWLESARLFVCIFVSSRMLVKDIQVHKNLHSTVIIQLFRILPNLCLDDASKRIDGTIILEMLILRNSASVSKYPASFPSGDRCVTRQSDVISINHRRNAIRQWPCSIEATPLRDEEAQDTRVHTVRAIGGWSSVTWILTRY